MDPGLSPWVGLLAPDREDRKWGLPHTVQHSHGDSNPKARTNKARLGVRFWQDPGY